MENTKPTLYVFGDSFAQWPYPVGNNKWWHLLEKEYNVVNEAVPGSDNSHIAFQLKALKEYKKGDRIVFVLSERTRIPKWFYHNSYEEYVDTRYGKLGAKGMYSKLLSELGINRKYSEQENYIHALQVLRTIQDSILEDKDLVKEENKRYREPNTDNPFFVYQFYYNLKTTILKNYRPVFVTWCSYTHDTTSSFVKHIDWGDYEHIKIEGENQDHHPSEKGHLHWYKVIKSELDS